MSYTYTAIEKHGKSIIKKMLNTSLFDCLILFPYLFHCIELWTGVSPSDPRLL